MTLISIITPAVAGTAADHLAAAYTSITSQVLPPNHQWEWLIQLDGDGELNLPEQAVNDQRVQPGLGPHGGPGMARNLALARSSGAIVVNLDADDQFTPGALGRIINALIDPDIGWTTSAMIDQLPDETRRRFDGDPPGGLLYRGSVTNYWKSHDWALQVHPSTLAVRRELLAAVGGWMGLPVSEDMGLLVALDQSAHGAFIAEPGVVRRIHPGQMTQRPEHQILVAQLRGLVWERATALDPVARLSDDRQKITTAPEPETDVPANPPRPSGEHITTPREPDPLAQWPIRIVLAVALIHLGVCIGIVVAAPDKMGEALVLFATSLVFYMGIGALAFLIRNSIQADASPVDTAGQHQRGPSDRPATARDQDSVNLPPGDLGAH